MNVRRAASLASLLVVASVVSGCGAYFAAHSSSPWEYGFGLRTAPGFALAESLDEATVTVHPVAGVSRLSFEGGNDMFLDVGGQVRYHMSAFWLGGEATYARLSTSIDGLPGNFTANGFAFMAIAGVPIGDSRWSPSVYAAAGMVRMGGGTGRNVNVGIDVQPWFLKR